MRNKILDLKDALKKHKKPSLMHEFGTEFIKKYSAIKQNTSEEEFKLLNTSLIRELLTEIPEHILRHDELSKIQETIDLSLKSPPKNYYYPNKEFTKDLRYALGLSLPAGARSIDLLSRTGGRIALHIAARKPRLFIKNQGNIPCLRLYLDDRLLENFNADGLTYCYKRAAEILKLNPTLAGVASKSWFNDPEVGKISPHLSHIYEIPKNGGALTIKGRSTEEDVFRATLTSKTRKTLYQQKKYTPRHYYIFWHREDIINWSTNQE